jgi:hypothetical protein
VDRYELLRVLGRRGTVLLARDTQLDRTVVLKHHPRTAASAERVRALLAMPPHPNVAIVRDDIGTADEHVLVQDFVDGVTLAQLAADKSVVGAADALRIAADVTSALDHLHGLALAHGDITASNVVVCVTDGGPQAVLVDASLDGGGIGTDRTRLHRLVKGLLAEAGVVRKRRSAPIVATAATLLLAAGALPLIVTQQPVISAPNAPEARAQTPIADAPHALALGAPLVAALATPELGAPPPATARVLPAAKPDPFGGRSRLVIYERHYEPNLEYVNYPAWVDVFRLDQGPVPQPQHAADGELPQFTHMVSLSKGWLFWYSTLDGVIVTTPISEEGLVGWGETIPVEPHWTHVAGDGEGLVWLYRRDTGLLETIRHRNGYHTHHERTQRLTDGFDLLTALSGGRALLYSVTGTASIATVNAGAVVSSVKHVTLPAGLSVLVYSGRGYLVGVRPDGETFVYRVTDSGITQVSTFRLKAVGLTSGAGFDHGFVVYNAAGVSATVVELDETGHLRSARAWAVPVAPLITELK